MPALGADRQLTVPGGGVQSAGVEGSAEHDSGRVLGDVDEAAGSDDPFVELGDIDVAGSVDLGKTQEGDVKASAVEVELVGLVQHRNRVGRDAENHAAGGNAADSALLDGEGEMVRPALLGGYRGYAVGDANAEVDDVAVADLGQGAAGDDLALVQRERFEVAEGGFHRARESRVVVVGDELTLLRVDDDDVHADAGHHHGAGVEAAALGDLLDLGDD